MEGYVYDELVTSGDAVLTGFGRVAGMLAGLVCGLAGPGAGTLEQIEEMLVAEGRRVLRAALQLVLDVQAEGEERQAEVTGADGVPRRRARRGQARGIVTSLGEVRVRRIGYRAEVRGVPALFPRDAVLNLPPCCYSWALQRLVVMSARDGAYELAQELVLAATGVRIGKRQLEEITAAASADVAGFYAVPVPGQPGEPDGQRPGQPHQDLAAAEQDLAEEEAGLPLALSADGKGVAMRPESRRKRTKAPGKRVKTPPRGPAPGRKAISGSPRSPACST